MTETRVTRVENCVEILDFLTRRQI